MKTDEILIQHNSLASALMSTDVWWSMDFIRISFCAILNATKSAKGE